MRAMPAGYDAIVERARRRCWLRVTIGGLRGDDLADYISSLALGMSLSAEADTLSVTFEEPIRLLREFDPGPPPIPAIPLAVGQTIRVYMGESEELSACVFAGQITQLAWPEDSPRISLTLTAIGGRSRWWRQRITTPAFALTSPEAIAESLWTQFGGLGVGEFDLPATGETLLAVPSLSDSLMALGWKLFTPWGYAPWWRPDDEQLATLPYEIPAAADAVLADTRIVELRPREDAGNTARVVIDGGVLPGTMYMEIGPWRTPAEVAAGDLMGDIWAEGDINTTRLPFAINGTPHGYVWWAESNGADPHADSWTAGDYLWGIWFTEEIEDHGTYVWGPERRRYTLPSYARVVGAGPVSAATLVAVENEAWNASLERQRCHVRFRIDAASVPGLVIPFDTRPHKVFQRIPTAYPDDLLAWVVAGRRMVGLAELDQEGVHQLSAQAWQASAIATWGDQRTSGRNETLIRATDPFGAVEREAVRSRQIFELLRQPVDLTLSGHDLRILPGDAVEARGRLLWVQGVHHSYQAGEGGGAMTQLICAKVTGP